MVAFQKGQKVKLNERGVRAIMATGGSPIRARVVDWSTRQGVVSRVTALKQIVIQWEGNRSPSDSLCPSIVEAVRDT